MTVFIQSQYACKYSGIRMGKDIFFVVWEMIFLKYENETKIMLLPKIVQFYIFQCR